VVLVPGLGSGSYLLAHGARLAAAAKVWIVDLPNFGRSRAPRRPATIPEWAGRLAQWHDAVVRVPAMYVGSSFGCQVVSALAAGRPDVVDRVVLVGPTFDAAARRLLPQLARWAVTTARERPSLGPKLLVSYLQSGPLTPMRAFFAALPDPTEERLRQVSAPVLIVRGEHDRIVPAEWAARLAATAPRARLAVVSGVSHAVDYAAPDELADLTLPFLTQPPTDGWRTRSA
jgi:pimeloyl-ACP methyl ester carboxylesterase